MLSQFLSHSLIKWLVVAVIVGLGSYVAYKGYFRIRHKMTKQTKQERNELFANKPAPDLTGTTHEGKKWSLQSQRGKNVIIVFWASWCRGCVKEIPFVMKSAEVLQGDPDTILVSVNLDKDPDKARSLIKEKGIVYPVLIDEKNLGMKSDFARAFDIYGIPSIWVIDKEGMVKGQRLRHIKEAIEILH